MSAKRLTRKEILRGDPFRDTLQDTLDAVIENKNMIIIILVAVVAVVGGVALWQNYSEKSEAEAHNQLSKGLEAFHATVRNPNDPPLTPEQQAMNPPSPYKTEAEKYSEALKRFQEAAAKHPSHRAGQLARYYAALSQVRLGQTDEAIKGLEALRGRFGEPTYDGMVKRTLAELYQAKGRHEEGVKLAQELLNDASSALPKDQLLMMLGQSYENLNKKDEALKMYTRLGQEYPTSTYFSDANGRISKLGGKPIPPPLPANPMGGPLGGAGLPFPLE